MAEPSITDQIKGAIASREAVPGQPLAGPYPASVDEVADEIVAFITELDGSLARGLASMVRDRLEHRPCQCAGATADAACPAHGVLAFLRGRAIICGPVDDGDQS